MVRCPKCKQDKLQLHENWNLNGILIDPQTETVHKCNPADKIIQFGKWVGYSYKEAADISDSVKRINAEYLRKREEEFRCGEPEPAVEVRVLPDKDIQNNRRPKRTLDETFST